MIKFCLLEIGVKSNGNPIQDEEGGVIRSISDTINNTQAVFGYILQVLMNTEESRTEMLSQLFEHRHHHSTQLEILEKNIKRTTLQPVLRPRALFYQASMSLQVEMGAEDNDENNSCAVRLAPRPLVKLYRSPQVFI